MVPAGREGIGAISINQWLVDVWWGDLRNPKKPLWKELLLGDMCTVEYEKIVYHQRPLILTTLPLVDRYWGKRRKKSWSLLIRFFAHIKSCWYHPRHRNGVTAPVLQEVFTWIFWVGISTAKKRVLSPHHRGIRMSPHHWCIIGILTHAAVPTVCSYCWWFRNPQQPPGIYIYIYIHITL